MEEVQEARDPRITPVRKALERIHGLLADALEASKELNAPRPIALGVRTALRLSLAELEGVLELLAE